MFGTGLTNLAGLSRMRGLDPAVLAALLQLTNKFRSPVVGGTTLGSGMGMGKGLMGTGMGLPKTLPMAGLSSLTNTGLGGGGFGGGTALSGYAPILASLALTKRSRLG